MFFKQKVFKKCLAITCWRPALLWRANRGGVSGSCREGGMVWAGGNHQGRETSWDIFWEKYLFSIKKYMCKEKLWYLKWFLQLIWPNNFYLIPWNWATSQLFGYDTYENDSWLKNMISFLLYWDKNFKRNILIFNKMYKKLNCVLYFYFRSFM